MKPARIRVVHLPPYKFGRRATILALASLSIAGCAIDDPLGLSSTGQKRAASGIEIVASEANGPLQKQFSEAFARELAARGIESAAGSPIVADLSIASRDADIAVLTSEPAAAGSLAVSGHARESRWYERCRAVRVLANLALFDRANGKLIYRGEAHADQCQSDSAPVEALTRLLVEDALPGSAS